MVKPLPSDDFRSRKILEPSDFAIHSGEPDPEPTDLIDQETWNHLTNLADDVSITTSSHFGSVLKELSSFNFLWLNLINSNNPRQPYLEYAMLEVYDDLEAVIFNLLHGYYKQSFQALRSVLDNTVIGSYLETTGQKILGEEWITGQGEIRFGDACTSLQNYPAINELESFLKKENDNLFQPKHKSYQGGLARRLFSNLSKYSHSRPGHTNGDLWQSNGPVFDYESFMQVVKSHNEVLLVCILLVKIVKEKFTPGSDNLITLSILCNVDSIKETNVLKNAIAYIFKENLALT